MSVLNFILSPDFGLYVLPMLIFCARIVDVSLGTVRVIFTIKGMKYISAFIGFFEVMVWLLAVTQIMGNLTNLVNYVAYAGGFAAGTFFGIMIEDRLAVGNLILRIITRRDPKKLVFCLRDRGYGTTIINAQGSRGPSKIILAIVKRKDLKEVVKLIKNCNPNAFYSIEDLRSVSMGEFPPERHVHRKNMQMLILKRKGK